MEQNLPVVAKRVRSLVRTILFMIKKNISKSKLLLDLNIMLKRGKALRHNNNNRHSPNFTFPPPPITKDYYEFSCSNTPLHPLSLFTTTLKKHHNYKKTSHKNNKSQINNKNVDHDQIFVDPAVIKALEMLTSAAASPAVHGFGKSPVVRQLRITDSPFPLSNGDEDSYVDEAAEKFIMKFYNELRRQSS